MVCNGITDRFFYYTGDFFLSSCRHNLVVSPGAPGFRVRNPDKNRDCSRLKSSCYFDNFIEVKNVVDFKVVEAGYFNAALQAGLDLTNVVFEVL